MSEKMNVAEYREQVLVQLAQIQEKHKYYKKTLERIDKHLEKINGKILDHEISLTRIKVWGVIGLILLPVVASAVARYIIQ